MARTIAMKPWEIQAIRNGKRRFVRPLHSQPEGWAKEVSFEGWFLFKETCVPRPRVRPILPMYPKHAELFVKEPWYRAFRATKTNPGFVYQADDDGMRLNPGWSPQPGGKGWNPSSSMPLSGVRFRLLVHESYAQRLCHVEAAPQVAGETPALDALQSHWAKDYGSRRSAFAWNRNPWVWVVEFSVLSGL